jgi:hypothetical protein
MRLVNLIEPLDPHADVLADLQLTGQGLADTGDQLHPFGVKQRHQHLARRDHVADIHFLVDDHAGEGRPEGGPVQHRLDFLDALPGLQQAGFDLLK